MDPNIQQYLDCNYPIAIAMEQLSNGEQIYTARLFDLPGCVAQASTREEAEKRLDVIKPGYFKMLVDQGVEIPEPTPFPPLVPGTMRFYNETSGLLEPMQRAHLEGKFVQQEMKLEKVS